MAKKLYVIGVGPGHPDYMVRRGHEIIDTVSTLVASERILADYAKKRHKVHAIKKLTEAVQFIRMEMIDREVAVLVSGDTGFYSFLSYLKQELPEMEMEVVTGIGSIPFAFSRIQKSWEHAKFLSFHGRVPKEEELSEECTLAFITDAMHTAPRIAQLLIEKGFSPKRWAAAFERLSYPDENAVEGALMEIAALDGFSHAVLIVGTEEVF